MPLSAVGFLYAVGFARFSVSRRENRAAFQQKRAAGTDHRVVRKALHPGAIVSEAGEPRRIRWRREMSCG